jgi:hypothetical protein
MDKIDTLQGDKIREYIIKYHNKVSFPRKNVVNSRERHSETNLAWVCLPGTWLSGLNFPLLGAFVSLLANMCVLYQILVEKSR